MLASMEWSVRHLPDCPMPDRWAEQNGLMLPQRRLARSSGRRRHAGRRLVEAFRGAVGCAKPPKPYGAEVLHIAHSGKIRGATRDMPVLCEERWHEPEPCRMCHVQNLQNATARRLCTSTDEAKAFDATRDVPTFCENIRNEPNDPIFRQKSM
jgi:hypothetical protein